MALLLLPLVANRTASGTFSHSPLLATYSAPAEPLVNTEVEISPALAPASSAGFDHNWISLIFCPKVQYKSILGAPCSTLVYALAVTLGGF